MRVRDGFGEWQMSALARYLKKNRDDPLLDSKTVFLVNPKEKTELDRLIKRELWPAVLDAVAKSPIQVFDLRNGVPVSGIDDGHTLHTCRSLVFVLEDAGRPLLPGSGPPWYCRGNLSCSPMDYMVSFTFLVYLPEDFNLRRILKLIGDPMFSGNPPNLSIGRGIGRGNIFVVAFSEGGAGWGIRSHGQAAEHLRRKVNQNLEVIKAVYELEKDFTSKRSFEALQIALRDAYQSF